jgi:hypothetical protein
MTQELKKWIDVQMLIQYLPEINNQITRELYTEEEFRNLLKDIKSEKASIFKPYIIRNVLCR